MDWPVFEGLPADVIQEVLRTARRRRFKRGEIVFHEGDPGDTLHLLAKGRVKVRVTTPLGASATLSVLGTGSIFGELALLSGADRRAATVTCLEAVETLGIHRDAFNELRDRQPRVDQVLVRILAAQLPELSARLLEALFVPADKRVLRELLRVAEVYGPPGDAVAIPLTQEDLAELAGTTRPTVNKVLRTIEDAGALRLGRGRIELQRPELIARQAR
jgi:CRP/FNR family cyclic AMP-dependent transcriptional regulator